MPLTATASMVQSMQKTPKTAPSTVPRTASLPRDHPASGDDERSKQVVTKNAPQKGTCIYFSICIHNILLLDQLLIVMIAIGINFIIITYSYFV